MRNAISPETDHISFLNSCLSWIKSWKFNAPRQPRTVQGWQVTIKAIILLWAELHDSFNFIFLLTRHLNQNVLENMFGIVWQQHGCNETPNPYQFAAGLKHIMVSKLFKLSDNSNCEEEKALLLIELGQLSLSRADCSLSRPERGSTADSLEEISDPLPADETG